MKRTILAIVLALALVVIPVSSAMASTSKDVTVKAKPVHLSFTALNDDAGTDWLVNDLLAIPVGDEGDGFVRPNILYYSNPLGDTTAPANPVVDGACYFTFDNNSNVAIDIYCKMADFTTLGAGIPMVNSEGGYTDNAGPNEFGASGYVKDGAWGPGPGVIFPRVLYSAKFISALAKQGGADTIKWGVALLTQLLDFDTDQNQESILTCTAVEAGKAAP
jgi:hypothetical protein